MSDDTMSEAELRFSAGRAAAIMGGRIPLSARDEATLDARAKLLKADAKPLEVSFAAFMEIVDRLVGNAVHRNDAVDIVNLNQLAKLFGQGDSYASKALAEYYGLEVTP